MFVRRMIAAAATAIVLAGCGSALSADLIAPRKALAPAAIPSALGWFVHIGPAGVVFAPSANGANVGGAQVDGSIKVPSNIALGADIGYFFTPDISASLTVATPPTATVKGKGGTLGTLGALGNTTYLPPILAAQYHFRQFGVFQPYVGAGVSYMIILGNSDKAISNFAVKSNLGLALQAGTDVMIDEHFGLFVDVKHVFLRTSATGTLGGAFVKTNVTLDPTIIHAGLTYRF